ncbi:MAG TPA: hypothetical protein VFS21_10880 [Roseiflexaceae bacterium]|nr:hypothetical protein [Roseiflexaceae bacterium]
MPNRAKHARATTLTAQRSKEAERQTQQAASSARISPAARGSVRGQPAAYRPADILAMQRTVGNRAVSRLLAPTRPSHQQPTAVQRYSIETEPKLGTLYSVSDDQRMVTGMGTPNHDLYVDRGSMLEEIRQATKGSMLAFSAGKTQELFGKTYTKVKVGFKKVQFTTPPEVQQPNLLQSIAGKGKPQEHLVDLDSEYQKKVVPGIVKQSKGKYKEVLEKIWQTLWVKSFGDVQTVLNTLVKDLELFKKLVIANQATEDYHDVSNIMEIPRRIVETVENAIYSDQATKSSLKSASDELQQQAQQMWLVLGADEHLKSALVDLIQRVGSLFHVMPEEMPVDLMLVHSANYQEAMLRSMEKGDPMFYRACDVMASTILANQITPQNEDQLKIYSAGGGSGAFHYAAKILKSGKDWVSLESFAASDRDAKVLGLNAKNRGMNLDNSWQYMMYGSIRKRGETVGEEDNAFELYTKLRYYLKGIKEPGRFSTNQRERLHSTIPKDAFVSIVGINSDQSTKIWETLQMSSVFNEEGEVKNPSYLEKDYIALRLPTSIRSLSQAISARLQEIYKTPSSDRKQIQGPASNELKNISGWLRLAQIPVDADKFEQEFGYKLTGDPSKSREVHNETWIALMLYLKGKKP